MKEKFKVGDKVRILDGRDIKDYTGGFTEDMKNYIGEIHTITSVFEHHGKVAYKLDDKHRYTWDERGLELAEKPCIVIYRNGDETIALDKTTGKKAVAKCSKDDTNDFYTGAKLAFDRLTGAEEKADFKPYLLLRNEKNGYLGEPTPLKDIVGRELRVGDTVELYTSEDIYFGEQAVCKDKDIAYVMSIKSDCTENGTVRDWKIIKKRKYEDIPHGEKVGFVKYVKE